jgi:UDP-2-acetamido-3-amino-2,3-dideoxy-glucuronate N-acetyltransferase
MWKLFRYMAGTKVHLLASVHRKAIIGRGAIVWRWTLIRERSIIGQNVLIGSHCIIGPDITIGEGCHIMNAVQLDGHISIGKNVYIGPGTINTNTKYPHANSYDPPRDSIIEDGASIGANVILLPGIRIGKGAVIGAGAVVTHDVEACATVVGNPARPLISKKPYVAPPRLPGHE